jgi:hypothetical protein
MDKYIGIAVQAASCTISVVDARGKQAGSYVAATNGQEIVECLRAIPGQRHVCFEEGTQSGWLHEILEPNAVEVFSRGPDGSHRGQPAPLPHQALLLVLLWPRHRDALIVDCPWVEGSYDAERSASKELGPGQRDRGDRSIAHFVRLAPSVGRFFGFVD